MHRITIIGGGASGTLLAANLLSLARGPLELKLVEKKEKAGLGVAYSTNNPAHLLNVPAGKMGAFPDEIGHFHKWLTANGFEYAETDFVPRKIYGQYLRSVLDRAAAERAGGCDFEMVHDNAADIDINGCEAAIMLSGGRVIRSDKTVLAFGNFLPPHPRVEGDDFKAAPKYFRDPWDPRVLRDIEADDSVLIIGTGLSMVDIALMLENAGHKGRISAISTRGILSAAHSPHEPYTEFHNEIRSKDRLSAMVKCVREHIAKAESNGGDWRGVIDSLRPVTAELWTSLPLSAKRRFMQHASRYWNAARHRMPPQAGEAIGRMLTDGKLEIRKGRLRSIETDFDGRFLVNFHAYGIDSTIVADAVVNCIGSESNFQRIDSPLVRSMYSKGYLQNDPVSLGIAALPNGAVIGKNGDISGSVWTLGTALKGILWESTAIPEIRVQARQLARQLLFE